MRIALFCVPRVYCIVLCATCVLYCSVCHVLYVPNHHVVDRLVDLQQVTPLPITALLHETANIFFFKNTNAAITFIIRQPRGRRERRTKHHYPAQRQQPSLTSPQVPSRSGQSQSGRGVQLTPPTPLPTPKPSTTLHNTTQHSTTQHNTAGHAPSGLVNILAHIFSIVVE